MEVNLIDPQRIRVELKDIPYGYWFHINHEDCIFFKTNMINGWREHLCISAKGLYSWLPASREVFKLKQVKAIQLEFETESCKSSTQHLTNLEPMKFDK